VITSEDIARTQWDAFFAEVSAARHGAEVTLGCAHALGPVHDDQHLALESVVYDRGDDTVIFELSRRDRPGEILTRHFVCHPLNVQADRALDEADGSIRVAAPSGTTLIEFHPHGSSG
jgi:hypothetical protein